jgi:(2Fe-2S) ferredoxin
MKVDVLEVWEELSIVVGDYDICSIKPVHLMCEHKCSLGIRIIRYHDTFWYLSVEPVQNVHMVRLDKFEQLGRLASRGGTHIKDQMV